VIPLAAAKKNVDIRTDARVLRVNLEAPGSARKASPIWTQLAAS
jgi:hypothetical protein